MSLNWKKIVKVGLKVAAAVVGGTAVYVGLSKLSGDKPRVSNSDTPRDFTQTGKKIVDGLKMGQAGLMAIIGVVGGVATVACSINQVLDKNYYTRMLQDGSVGGGYFGRPMIPSSLDGPVTWTEETSTIRRNKNVIEVW